MARRSSARRIAGSSRFAPRTFSEGTRPVINATHLTRVRHRKVRSTSGLVHPPLDLRELHQKRHGSHPVASLRARHAGAVIAVGPVSAARVELEIAHLVAAQALRLGREPELL